MFQILHISSIIVIINSLHNIQSCMNGLCNTLYIYFLLRYITCVSYKREISLSHAHTKDSKAHYTLYTQRQDSLRKWNDFFLRVQVSFFFSFFQVKTCQASSSVLFCVECRCRTARRLYSNLSSPPPDKSQVKSNSHTCIHSFHPTSSSSYQ